MTTTAHPWPLPPLAAIIPTWPASLDDTLALAGDLLELVASHGPATIAGQAPLVVAAAARALGKDIDALMQQARFTPTLHGHLTDALRDLLTTGLLDAPTSRAYDGPDAEADALDHLDSTVAHLRRAQVAATTVGVHL